MRKQLLYLFLAFVYIWSWSIFNALKADERVINTTGHIIVETVKGTDIDHSAIMNAEIQKLVHNFSMEIIAVFSNNLPSILDGISAELRANADKNYKCALQSDDYKNKDCK